MYCICDQMNAALVSTRGSNDMFVSLHRGFTLTGIYCQWQCSNYFWSYTNKQQLALTPVNVNSTDTNIDYMWGSTYKRSWSIGCWVRNIISALIPRERLSHSQSCQINHRWRAMLSLGQTFLHFSTSDNTDACGQHAVRAGMWTAIAGLFF